MSRTTNAKERLTEVKCKRGPCSLKLQVMYIRGACCVCYTMLRWRNREDQQGMMGLMAEIMKWFKSMDSLFPRAAPRSWRWGGIHRNIPKESNHLTINVNDLQVPVVFCKNFSTSLSLIYSRQLLEQQCSTKSNIYIYIYRICNFIHKLKWTCQTWPTQEPYQNLCPFID